MPLLRTEIGTVAGPPFVSTGCLMTTLGHHHVGLSRLEEKLYITEAILGHSQFDLLPMTTR